MGQFIKTRRVFSNPEHIFSFSEPDGYQIYETDDEIQHQFLMSGILSVKNDILVDVFLVGGGGGGGTYRSGGGGGGYTKTARKIQLLAGQEYEIVIGEGGVSAAPGKTGGTTSAFGYTAKGGDGGGTGSSDTGNRKGGAGGSGGGGGASTDGKAGAGGSNGGNGGAGSGGSNTSGNGAAGTGQGYTTRAFGEEYGNVYAGGGAGASANSSNVTTIEAGGDGGGGNSGEAGKENTGGGGGGGGYVNTGGVGGAGGSGIVIIRKYKPITDALYLYSPGDQHTGITGDWVGIKRDPTGSYSSTDRAPIITPGETSIYADNTGTVCGAFYTALKIDMTPYKTLVFEGEFKRTGTYGTGFMPGVWSDMTGYANGSTRLAYTQQEDNDKNLIFNRYEVDVMDVNEHGYVGINLANAYARVTACYLIPKE